MGNPISFVRTSEIKPTERSGYWADALSRLCGRLRADAPGGGAIDGQIESTNVGPLRLCRISASQHRIILPSAWAGRGEHAVIKFLFQTNGTSTFEQDGSSIAISKGDCFAYDVSRPHTIVNPTATTHDVAIIPKSLMVQRGIKLDDLHGRCVSAREGVGRLAHGCLASALNEAPTISSDSEHGVGEALLDLLLLSFSERALSSTDWIGPQALRHRIKAYIGQNLSDPELCIDHIAAALRCSKRHLHASFANEPHGINEYIWIARLERCRRSLEASANSYKSVTEVAFSWGFSSSSHFSRTFKRRYGVTPSTLQKQAGQAERG